MQMSVTSNNRFQFSLNVQCSCVRELVWVLGMGINMIMVGLGTCQSLSGTIYIIIIIINILCVNILCEAETI